MNSQTELRIELRRALDEVLPPAPWLEAVVIDDLRKRRPSRLVDRGLGKSQQRRIPLPRPAIQLAAVLIVVLAAAAVATFLALRYQATQIAPAGTLSIEAYQTMVNRDVTQLDSAGDGVSCTTLQSTCPAPGEPVLVAYQRLLGDLNRSGLPAKFAVIDAQMRRHVAAAIADVNAVIAAYRAQDKYGLDDANAELQRQAYWVDVIASSIISSHPETAATYLDKVRAGKDDVAACPGCQSLGSTSQDDCAGIQSANCGADVAYAKSSIQDFEAVIIRYAAPSSLAAQDARLLRDLVLADTGVLTMANAQLTGDQASFNAGRLMFRQALQAVNTDIAAILGG